MCGLSHSILPPWIHSSSTPVFQFSSPIPSPNNYPKSFSSLKPHSPNPLHIGRTLGQPVNSTTKICPRAIILNILRPRTPKLIPEAVMKTIPFYLITSYWHIIIERKFLKSRIVTDYLPVAHSDSIKIRYMRIIQSHPASPTAKS
jgi:hypothetical protein